ncbi:hypothetical protein L0Y65_02470 [Candidatus Micrarchaeota archaeon]|nr:hypothetical protein [Candidatus Micrarchaeota archaeon]
MARHAAFLLTLLFFSGTLCALTIGPRIYEQRDLGDIALSEFTYSLSADCNASTISAYVFNESNGAVRDANIYVKYVDFSTPLMSNTKTDKDGFTLIRLPGNVMLMRGMFIMVIEKKGFRNKEVHLDLSPCFGGSTLPPKPPTAPTNQSANTTNQTGPPAPPANNTTTDTTPGNGTAPAYNATNQTNQTDQANGGDGALDGSPPDLACPAAAGLAGLLALALIIRKVGKRGPPRWTSWAARRRASFRSAA